MTSPVLAIENLVVRYPEAERPTLDGLTLSLSPGDRLALPAAAKAPWPGPCCNYYPRAANAAAPYC
jgi:hypothetical protein